ncbi:MAG: type I restriction enzyme HsdR N-terminal domain-containing protein [Bacteroidaceae bacterium]|nr:type I restriction enzyme HsdR N-terminal domain-containing protein [Bacteroidaceae bacterium]
MKDYPQLNLPMAQLKVRLTNGRAEVFDPLRGRFVALTPEEWVRQHFTAYLIRDKHYPTTLMVNEMNITLGNVSRRCDTVLFTPDREPRMIIEYKATSVPLTRKVFDQITRYNMVLHTPWLCVSNGLQHVCCSVDYLSGAVNFLDHIPNYNEITNQ